MSTFAGHLQIASPATREILCHAKIAVGVVRAGHDHARARQGTRCNANKGRGVVGGEYLTRRIRRCDEEHSSRILGVCLLQPLRCRPASEAVRDEHDIAIARLDHLNRPRNRSDPIVKVRLRPRSRLDTDRSLTAPLPLPQRLPMRVVRPADPGNDHITDHNPPLLLSLSGASDEAS